MLTKWCNYYSPSSWRQSSSRSYPVNAWRQSVHVQVGSQVDRRETALGSLALVPQTSLYSACSSSGYLVICQWHSFVPSPLLTEPQLITSRTTSAPHLLQCSLKLEEISHISPIKHLMISNMLKSFTKYLFIYILFMLLYKLFIRFLRDLLLIRL